MYFFYGLKYLCYAIIGGGLHMNKFVCEMCSSTELIKQDGVFVCQSCGCKYTVEEAKKLMTAEDGAVNVTGSVRIDSSDDLQNLYELARRAKEENNSQNAANYYGQIIVKDPSSWEANFYNTYFQSMNCTIAQIYVSAQRVLACSESVFKLIKDNVRTESEKRKAIAEVTEKIVNISTLFFIAEKNNYDSIDYNIKANFIKDFLIASDMCSQLCYLCGDTIIDIFGDDYSEYAVILWESGVDKLHTILNYILRNHEAWTSIIEDYTNKIKKYKPNYVPKEIQIRSGGCYIATAVYGSYDCPEVWTLRRFRDYSLSRSWYGRTFIRVYYAISPKLVKLFGDKKWFVDIWKKKLDFMVVKLQKDGFESTPYDDMNW